MTSIEVLDFIVKVLEIIILPLLGWFIRWGYKKYQHVRRGRDTFRELQKAMWKEFQLKLKRIEFQLYPNGSSSLSDKIIHSFDELHLGQQNILEIINVATWKSDKEGKISWVSIAMCDLLGATQSELLGLSWTGVIVPDDRDRVIKDWLQAVRNITQFGTTFTIKKADGYFQTVKGFVIHNKDKNGSLLSSIGKLTGIGEPFKDFISQK